MTLGELTFLQIIILSILELPIVLIIMRFLRKIEKPKGAPNGRKRNE